MIVLGKIKALKSGDGVSEMYRLYTENQKLEWHWTLKNKTKNVVVLSKLYRNMVCTLDPHTYPTIKYEGGGKNRTTHPFSGINWEVCSVKTREKNQDRGRCGIQKTWDPEQEEEGVPNRVVKAPPREMSP